MYISSGAPSNESYICMYLYIILGSHSDTPEGYLITCVKYFDIWWGIRVFQKWQKIHLQKTLCQKRPTQHTDIIPQKTTKKTTYSNESCHTCPWIKSHMWMDHVAHMNESCRINEWVMLHVRMSLVTHINESCYTHVTHMNESCTARARENETHLIFSGTGCIWLVYSRQNADSSHLLDHLWSSECKTKSSSESRNYCSRSLFVWKSEKRPGTMHVTHMNESCHTHATHTNESCNR